MKDFYQKLNLSVEKSTIDKINDYIDKKCYRYNNDLIFETTDLFENLFGKKHKENYNDRIGGGPGRNLTSFINLPSNIISGSNIQKIVDIVSLKHKATAVITKIPPNYYLSWHVDLSRTVGINIPLDNLENSFTFFTTEEINEQSVNTKSLSITKLNYELYSMFVLNTKKYHTVFNTKIGRAHV